MAKENKTAYIILGLLEHEDLSGYDIKKKIDYMISHFWEVGYGQIYPTLNALEDRGDIVKRPGGTYKGPERNLYSITDSGRKALLEWLKISEIKDHIHYEILLKLFFGSMISVEENMERIRIFKEKQLENRTTMEFFKRNLQQVLSEDEDHLYYYMTVLFGEKVYGAYISWAEEVLELLESFQKEKAEESEKTPLP
jgi:Predicted transcriptional regulators